MLYFIIKKKIKRCSLNTPYTNKSKCCFVIFYILDKIFSHFRIMVGVQEKIRNIRVRITF